MRKVIVASLFTLLLSGCGMISNTTMSDEQLQKKAAFALGTTPDKIKISDRDSTIDSVTFTATYKGKAYPCYIGSSIVITSDAICSGTSNALTRAAGL